MKRFLVFLLLIAPMIVGCSPAADLGLVDLDYADLISVRKKIKAKDSSIIPAYQKLISEADSYLLMEPEKVIDGDTPPTGDSHDFYAIGKYSWPNPNTPDGMPWIRIDCNINPDANGFRFDLARYNRTVSRVKILSLAWFHSQDEKYARKASELLRVWFLDEKTRMNPNFNCASALPGVHDGMAIGIIFGVTLVEMIDYVKLLNLSDSWSEQDNNSLKEWFSEYIKWLLESEFGIKEGKAKNNHGSWYSAQIAAYALFTGEMHHATNMMELAKKQMAEQIDTDGSLPQELRRDWALNYSIYGLRAFTTLARCGDIIGVDLWNYQTPNGRGLKNAYLFLQLYLFDKKEWTWGTDGGDKKYKTDALPMIQWAAKKYSGAGFSELVDYLKSFTSDNFPKLRLTCKM